MVVKPVLIYGNLCIDPKQRKVCIGEENVRLTTMEFDVLYYLASHPGWSFTREQIYQCVRRDDFSAGPESVTSRIYQIRKKIKTDAICTIYGYGYRFEL